LKIADSGEEGLAVAKRLLASPDAAAAQTVLGLRDGATIAKLLEKAGGEVMAAKIVREFGAGGAARAIAVMETGLTPELAIQLQRFGGVGPYLRIAEDAEALAAATKLLGGNTKGTVLTKALEDTAAFFDKYKGRASGDFVSRFAQIAKDEEAVAKAQAEVDAGKDLKNATKHLGEAQAELARARVETNLATDILEGKTPFGKDRTVHGLPESTSPSRRRSETRRVVLERTHGSRSSRRRRRDQRAGGARRAAGRAHPARCGREYVLADERAAARADQRRVVEHRAEGSGTRDARELRRDLRYGASGARQQLLLKLDGSGTTIDAAGTTRP